MRKVLKLSGLFFISSFFYTVSHAQLVKLPRALVYGNIGYASPSNNTLNDNYKGGIAGEIGAGVGLGKTILTGSIGYQVFASHSGVAAGNLRVVPVKAGVRRYLIGKLFLQAHGGMAFQSYAKSPNTGSNFIYELGAGIKVLKMLELQLSTNGWKQPNAASYSNALLFKAGWSIRI